MAHDMYTKGNYLQNNPSWHVEDSPWKAQQILKILKRNNLQPASIAEVGCGVGEIIHQLYMALPETTSFTGYEISPQAFDLCQSRKNNRITFYLEDILENKEVFYDAVLAIDLFEHVEDYLGFLKKLRTKGAYKIFHIPLDVSVQSVLRSKPIIDLRSTVGHLHYFTKETALATLHDSGYEIIDYFYTATALDLPSKGLKAKLARLPRKMLYAMHQDMAARILGGYSLMVLAK